MNRIRVFSLLLLLLLLLMLLHMRRFPINLLHKRKREILNDDLRLCDIKRNRLNAAATAAAAVVVVSLAK